MAPIPAQPGFFVALIGQQAETPAPAGSYDPGTGAVAPIPAIPGYFISTVGQRAETPAPAGSYDPGTGNVADSARPGFFVALIGQQAETPAPAGSYDPGTGNVTQIPQTRATSSAQSAKRPRRQHRRGATIPAPAMCAISRSLAFSSRYRPTGRDASPRWKLRSRHGQCRADPRTPGLLRQHSRPSAETPAPAGSYDPGTGNVAPSCAAWLFRRVDRPTRRDTSPRWKLRSRQGQRRADPTTQLLITQSAKRPRRPAPAGSYDPGTGNVAPIPAQPGFFVAVIGQRPRRHPRWKLRSRHGQHLVDPRRPGLLRHAIGQAAETPAPAGSYDPGTGNVAPIPAQPGFFVALIGQQAETPAPAGSYDPGTGNVSVPQTRATSSRSWPSGRDASTGGELRSRHRQCRAISAAWLFRRIDRPTGRDASPRWKLRSRHGQCCADPRRPGLLRQRSWPSGRDASTGGKLRSRHRQCRADLASMAFCRVDRPTGRDTSPRWKLRSRHGQRRADPRRPGLSCPDAGAAAEVPAQAGYYVPITGATAEIPDPPDNRSGPATCRSTRSTKRRSRSWPRSRARSTANRSRSRLSRHRSIREIRRRPGRSSLRSTASTSVVR